MCSPMMDDPCDPWPISLVCPFDNRAFAIEAMNEADFVRAWQKLGVTLDRHRAAWDEGSAL